MHRARRGRRCADSSALPGGRVRRVHGAATLGSVVGGFGVALLLVLQGTGCTSTTEPTDGGLEGVVCLPLDAGLPAVASWRGVDAGPNGEPLANYLEDYYSAFCDAISR